MKRAASLLLAGLLGCAVTGNDAPQAERASAANVAGAASADVLRADVEALASDAMEGRLTGSEGERLASEHIAAAFEAAGLEPAGDAGGWFQPFEFTAGVSLGTGNTLRAQGTNGDAGALKLERDWRPLAFSRTGESGAAPVVFAGYGIVAPPNGETPGYDSYAGLEVAGRWVLLLRYAPQDVTPAQRMHWSRYASLRHKVMLARDRGALGVLFASGPRSGVRDELIPLRGDAATGAVSVFALSVSDTLANAWLAGSDKQLIELQQALDGGGPVAGFELQSLRLDANVDLVQERRAGRNVLGRLRAPRGEGAEPVLIGAHFDHLGRGLETSSLAGENERGKIHSGADDNASGVAALLEIARLLAARARSQPEAFARDVLFAAWSGEELGLLGSAAFAREFPDPTALAHGAARPLAVALNLDMVGRLRDHLTLLGVGSSSVWDAKVAEANAATGLSLALQPESYLPTDTTTFYLKGIPVLSGFTGVHPEYHTPRDTPATLDYAGLARVTDFFAALTGLLAADPELPDYRAPAHAPLPPRAGLRAYLGTLPSYGESEGSGVLLSGVAKGGPAEKAGIQAGDRIVELAGHGVENIYDYTYALDALAIGTPVPIVVLRDGQRVTLTITPGSRE